jgi:hypothetical protein
MYELWYVRKHVGSGDFHLVIETRSGPPATSADAWCGKLLLSDDGQWEAAKYKGDELMVAPQCIACNQRYLRAFLPQQGNTVASRRSSDT